MEVLNVLIDAIFKLLKTYMIKSSHFQEDLKKVLNIQNMCKYANNLILVEIIIPDC